VFYDFHTFSLLALVYENGLSLCSDNEKSVVFTALGMSAFKFKLEDSIANFFKSFQSTPLCIQSLFALCSIGFLKNDMKLITAVFKELEKITDYTFMFDILKLKCIYSCLKVILNKILVFKV
jgi:hypothetical protein